MRIAFQVRMLELESSLEKERQKLGRLRKAHYQIAAELGLIEQVKLGFFWHLETLEECLIFSQTL